MDGLLFQALLEALNTGGDNIILEEVKLILISVANAWGLVVGGAEGLVAARGGRGGGGGRRAVASRRQRRAEREAEGDTV